MGHIADTEMLQSVTADIQEIAVDWSLGFVNMLSLLVCVVLIPLFVVHIIYVAITGIVK